jgi:hypothetical protein
LSFVRRLRDLGLDQALVGLAVNPRAWDASVAAKAAADPGAKAFAALWKALDGAGLGLHLARDARLSAALRLREADLPASARRVLASAAQASELWASFPDNALLAMARRLDLAGLYEVVAEGMTKEARAALEAELERTAGAVLGKGFVKEVLPALGPDWGLCVTAPPAEGKQWVPNVVLALKVARGEEGDPIDEAVLSAVQTWAQVAVLAHNKLRPGQALSLRSAVVGGGRVRYVTGEGVFPAGVQPAFGLRAGYLVLASSPAELGRFKGGKPAPAGAVPLLRLSLKDWRAYLKDRREPLAAALAAKTGMSRERALQKIDELRASVGLFDRVELWRRSSPGFVSFTLALEPAAPLKK